MRRPYRVEYEDRSNLIGWYFRRRIFASIERARAIAVTLSLSGARWVQCFDIRAPGGVERYEKGRRVEEFSRGLGL